MDIYQGFDNIRESSIVIALGNFDGVHLGHRELIRKTVETAGKENGIPAVLTFDPHPMKILRSESCPPMLLTTQDKIRILSELGIKLLIITPFTFEIAGLQPEQFVKDVLVEKLKVKTVVVGYNYSFGRHGTGNAGMLADLAGNYGLKVIVAPPVRYGEIEISSTLIRQLLLEGFVSEAAKYLGYFPFVSSRVVSGDCRGREIGFPTANLDLPDGVLAPARGVYAVRVYTGADRFDGVANIGIKPTFGCALPQNLEVHLFNFSGNIYGQIIKVEFIERIRGEHSFSTIEELIGQIHKDATAARDILQSAG